MVDVNFKLVKHGGGVLFFFWCFYQIFVGAEMYYFIYHFGSMYTVYMHIIIVLNIIKSYDHKILDVISSLYYFYLLYIFTIYCVQQTKCGYESARLAHKS